MKKRHIFANKLPLILIIIIMVSMPVYSNWLLPDDANFEKIDIYKSVASGDMILTVESIIKTDKVYNTICGGCNNSNFVPNNITFAESINRGMFSCQISGEGSIKTVLDPKEIFYIINIQFIKTAKSSLSEPSFRVKMPEVSYKRDKVINGNVEQVEEAYIYNEQGNGGISCNDGYLDTKYGVNDCFCKNIFKTNWPHEEKGQTIIKGYKEFPPKGIEIDSKENRLYLEFLFECNSEIECKDTDTCINYQCKELQCPEGYYADKHSCQKVECMKDEDCDITETCISHICKTLNCGYGTYAANYKCNAYECMKNANCKDNQICFNSTCISLDCNEEFHAYNHSCFPYECKANEDCKNNEVCKDYKCNPFSCTEEQVARGHKCKELTGIAKMALKMRLAIINWFS